MPQITFANVAVDYVPNVWDIGDSAWENLYGWKLKGEPILYWVTPDTEIINYSTDFQYGQIVSMSIVMSTGQFLWLQQRFLDVFLMLPTFK